MNFDLHIRHKSLKEEIFDVLHRQIISGGFSPGEWLRQEEIATQMGVSMTPAREALDLLVSVGLAERVPYRGVRVLKLSTQEIVEAYGIRLLLEVEAAWEAAERITPDQIRFLNSLVDRMNHPITLDDMPDARQLSREFHLSIVAVTENILLNKLYGVVINTFPDWMLYETMFRHPDLLEESMAHEKEDHTAIIKALSDNDPSNAAKNTLNHLLHLGEDLKNLLNIPARLIHQKEQSLILKTSRNAAS